MGGGLMQLVAYGAQDIYLTGNPQITFFKVVYRRHTNFSMETIQQTFNGAPSQGGNSVATISRNGDLVYKCYVTDSAGTTTSTSEWIQEVELEIGGQRIDRHYKEWMNIWNELSTPESKAIGLKAMQLDIGAKTDADNSTGVVMAQIPLLFWFCRNPGMALPLIALQYHEVKLKFKWGSESHGFVSTCKPQLWCDYIYLDTDERRRFAQVSHEYLIEQVQKESYTEKSGDHKLNFNHPVKELIWTTTGPNAYKTAKLRLNGHDRFASQEEEYFQLRQPFDYHTAVPRQNLPTAAQLTNNNTIISTTVDGLPIIGGTIAFTAAGGGADLTAVTSTNAHIAVLTQARTAMTGDNAIISNETTGATGTAVADDQPSDEEFVAALKEDRACMIVTTAVGVFWKRYQGRLIRLTGTQLNGAAFGQSSTEMDVVLTEVRDNTTETVPGAVLGPVSLLFFDRQVFLHTAVSTTNDITNVRLFEPNADVTTEARTSKLTQIINVYSFALKPEEHQPSGTCNFSRIDNAQLNFEIKPNAGGNIYAVNYNVLRIMSGMGGLAYSN